MAIIYVDIDGTLTVETEGYGSEIYAKRTPRINIINHVNKLHEAGDTIVIWTARFPEDREDTVRWLFKHKVKYHKLILGKPHFDSYICDRVINVNDLL